MTHQYAVQTIHLPQCWVCGERFADAGGTAQREEHHIIPQAQGGTDGPTVSLCDSHHTTLHKIAHRLHAETDWSDLVVGLSLAQVKQVLWLAQCVQRSENAMRDDPNKRTNVILSTDARQRQMLDALKAGVPALAGVPKITSRTAALAYALELAYRLHTNHNRN